MEQHTNETATGPKASERIPLPLLQRGKTILLELWLWLSDLSRLLRGKQMGDEQRSHLDLPGL